MYGILQWEGRLVGWLVGWLSPERSAEVRSKIPMATYMATDPLKPLSFRAQMIELTDAKVGENSRASLLQA